MSEGTLIDIYCDANRKIGFGHVRRSSALAAALQKENIVTRLIGISAEARSFLPMETGLDNKAAIVIFDVPEGIEELIRDTKKMKQVTVTLDWFGDEVPDINIVVYPHSEVKALKATYIGFEYIILRDEILRCKTHKERKNTDNVLVCLGGADLLGQGYEAAVLLNAKGFNVTLVQGPLVTGYSPVSGITVILNPSDFPERLAGCGWAVTNGGGCLFEANYFEKSAYVLPQTEWEIRIAHKINETEGVIGIGLEGLKQITHKPLSLQLTRQIKNFVDGKGSERIVKIIKNLL